MISFKICIIEEWVKMSKYMDFVHMAHNLNATYVLNIVEWWYLNMMLEIDHCFQKMRKTKF